MESIKASLLLSKTSEDVYEWFKIRSETKIYLPLKRTTTGKTRGIANQRPFSQSLKQTHAMYLNYENCVSENEPVVRVRATILSNNKNKDIFILVSTNSKGVLRTFVISHNQIAGNRDITVV